MNTLFDITLNINLDISSLLDLHLDHQGKVLMTQLVRAMALKWILNNLSTGGHVLKGKVFENRMVDVKVSNNKLYYRAICIVQVLFIMIYIIIITRTMYVPPPFWACNI